ncbi:MAG: ATP synthase F0 subunit B [Acidobacteria bacterium]|nr:F0F1 ATP synthase subunit B [Acidobacteriota bacterium]TDI38080.1 MAG: ATP synthase F0 subunit B [Acidobacteriota bacterium]TDI49737.1 MAG: ATP synthase F0 subunit B [Acidobacteriota bacterium]
MQFLIATILYAEHEESGSNVSLVLPERAELIAGILAFAIVFFFVWKWALPTLNQTLETRQQAVSGQLADAEKAKVEAESLLSDYQAQLADAKSEGNRILEDARATAEQMKTDLLSKAEGEADHIRSKARDDASAEKSRALSDARTQVGDISVDLAGKIVGEVLDPEAHQALIERYLADLESL